MIYYNNVTQRKYIMNLHDFKSGHNFNANVVCDINGDISYPGSAGEDIRILKAQVKEYNQNRTSGPKIRVGLQGRLGPKSEFAHLYKGIQNRRIKLKHSAYVGVYIWYIGGTSI